MAAWFSLNGNGEMTGTTWIDEGGFLEGPILITNTHSVGVVRDAAIAWSVKHGTLFQPWSLPVVAETWDGTLNDINGFHVKPEHVFQALDSARGGPVPEGNVGGGTGMICYEFKCGSGTASRHVGAAAGGYTVGVFVQANHGRRSELRIAGVPVGRQVPVARPGGDDPQELGSIIIVVATDAPVLPHQLERLARRASLGLARTGATSGNGSGDIFIAFSTANAGAALKKGCRPGRDAPEQPRQRTLQRDGRSHRGSDRQRAGGRGNDDWDSRLDRGGTTTRSLEEDSCEVPTLIG